MEPAGLSSDPDTRGAGRSASRPAPELENTSPPDESTHDVEDSRLECMALDRKLAEQWAASNPTTRPDSCCRMNEQPYTAVVQIRRDGGRAYVNGKLKSSRKTDCRDVGADVNWGLPDARFLGLGTYESPTEFRQVDLLEVTGRGRPAE